MRATVMYGAGDVRVEHVPDAAISEPTDALIRVARACICGSDLHPYHQMERSETGTRMGHEAIGVVEAVGDDVRTVKAGVLRQRHRGRRACADPRLHRESPVGRPRRSDRAGQGPRPVRGPRRGARGLPGVGRARGDQGHGEALKIGAVSVGTSPIGEAKRSGKWRRTTTEATRERSRS